MKCPVLHDFIEKEHKGLTYQKGEIYPKTGFEADPKRVAFLQTNKNKYKMVFLGPEINEEPKKPKKKPPKTSDK
ncbi:hypothetical protein B5V89_05105 [Heyndrickxia sporothermodurans]|uniref:hypothetical protein n=1 Tax=Heyndrickxia sporothermodurans TaxID=46224 RepID=UPI000D38A8D2|nr:hypothetical protein [Heyndrickxia sporothermodurans]PTY79625.1 hypothetical protein B5V89_05105 [Heyndrickxia sporothermodurans]